MLGGWFAIILVLSLYRQRKAGNGRLLEETQEGHVEYAFGEMSNDCREIRSGILFGTPATGSKLNVQIGDGCATCQSM